MNKLSKVEIESILGEYLNRFGAEEKGLDTFLEDLGAYGLLMDKGYKVVKNAFEIINEPNHFQQLLIKSERFIEIAESVQIILDQSYIPEE